MTILEALQQARDTIPVRGLPRQSPTDRATAILAMAGGRDDLPTALFWPLLHQLADQNFTEVTIAQKWLAVCEKWDRLWALDTGYLSVQEWKNAIPLSEAVGVNRQTGDPLDDEFRSVRTAAFDAAHDAALALAGAS